MLRYEEVYLFLLIIHGCFTERFREAGPSQGGCLATVRSPKKWGRGVFSSHGGLKCRELEVVVRFVGFENWDLEPSWFSIHWQCLATD
ncbi:hypothetical protein BDV95DRAFT_576196 [Massariosphaeria phaeospora]|uniref:Uncharacterized protein n=1 Tax=Massariosphaeria phaeospora TaxID=100035 RepID=A0A7C8I3A8_9PLEO|nr:hypothetical protein BDV95DRAFT_576196 [Massariosphaeria phaeospora]